MDTQPHNEIEDIFSYIQNTQALRVGEIEREPHNEVWVVNTTKPQGVIGITLQPEGNRKSIAIMVPATWIPTCITEKVAKADLIKSHNFREAVSNNTLKIIDHNIANIIMNHPTVKRELKKVGKSSVSITDKPMPQHLDDAMPRQVKQMKKSDTAGVSAFVVGALESTMDTQDRMVLIRSRADELTSTDYAYIVEHSDNQQLKSWAAKQPRS